MGILKNSSSEYYITMHDNTDLDSLDHGLGKLCDDEVIVDWDNSEFDEIAYGQETKEIHIYIDKVCDIEKNWKRIGNTLGMSLLDLHHAKKLVTNIHRANFEDVPEDSLWDTPSPGAKEVKDYHGGMITLSRLDQLKEDDANFFACDWLDECLLFYLNANEDTTELLQKIESLLLQTEEA